MKLLSHFTEKQNKMFSEIVNWKNHSIGDYLSYSYRSTVYNKSNYPSDLHYHNYYELIVFEDGEIDYICESNIFTPKHGDIIVIPPSKLHMSRIRCNNTHYKRHVFYLYENAFDIVGHPALTGFLKKIKEGVVLSLQSIEKKQELSDLLLKLSMTFDVGSSPLEAALCFGYVIQIFYILNSAVPTEGDNTRSLPDSILELQRFIDDNFCEISSVSEIADRFYYSREYVSRLFRKHLDTTISDYIHKRRISESQSLIAQGIPIIDACYKVGYGSLSTFIRAFRAVTGMTPSEYKKMIR